MTMLEVRKVSKHFGGVHAVDGVSFAVEKGKITAIIGPNGAGKTTLFNIITGLIPPSEGSIYFGGEGISGLQPYEIARKGISRTFQNLELFGGMSVLESVMVGGFRFGKSGFFSSLLGLNKITHDQEIVEEKARRAMKLVGLEDKADWVACQLPYGQQRLVEVARALCLQPALLLLDEPVAGLNPAESTQLGSLICQLREQGLTILFVEHDMETVMDVADKIVVLEFGRKLAEGTPEVIQNDPKVITAYLGEEVD